MGFSKKTIKPKPNEMPFEIIIPPVLLGDSDEPESFTLTLGLESNLLAAEANQKFLALKKEDRTVDKLVDNIRDLVCKLMIKEPENIDDFPADQRSLGERAIDYFSNNEPEIQEFIDNSFWEIWQQYKDFNNLKVFFRSVQDDSKGISNPADSDRAVAAGS